MRLDDLTEDAATREIGRRVARHRLALELTQADLAERAGVARSTVQRIERGESVQLSSFVRLLRALDRLDALDGVLEAEVPSPLAELDRERGRPPRRRARGRRRDPGGGGWTWADEDA